MVCDAIALQAAVCRLRRRVCGAPPDEGARAVDGAPVCRRVFPHRDGTPDRPPSICAITYVGDVVRCSLGK